MQYNGLLREYVPHTAGLHLMSCSSAVRLLMLSVCSASASLIFPSTSWQCCSADVHDHKNGRNYRLTAVSDLLAMHLSRVTGSTAAAQVAGGVPCAKVAHGLVCMQFSAQPRGHLSAILLKLLDLPLCDLYFALQRCQTLRVLAFWVGVGSGRLQLADLL